MLGRRADLGQESNGIERAIEGAQAPLDRLADLGMRQRPLIRRGWRMIAFDDLGARNAVLTRSPPAAPISAQALPALAVGVSLGRAFTCRRDYGNSTADGCALEPLLSMRYSARMYNKGQMRHDSHEL